ncbi:hypothetical protein CCP4SC76_6720009 [Gammaproteobacteria bacterium]
MASFWSTSCRSAVGDRLTRAWIVVFFGENPVGWHISDGVYIGLEGFESRLKYSGNSDN